MSADAVCQVIGGMLIICWLLPGSGEVKCKVCDGQGSLARGGFHKRNPISIDRIVGEYRLVPSRSLYNLDMHWNSWPPNSQSLSGWLPADTKTCKNIDHSKALAGCGCHISYFERWKCVHSGSKWTAMETTFGWRHFHVHSKRKGPGKDWFIEMVSTCDNTTQFWVNAKNLKVSSLACSTF